jgi:L-histidine N-alpha-methyltransferase
MRNSGASKTEFITQEGQTIRPPGQPVLLAEFAADVRAGLSKKGQKELYSKYFYDDVGSALFDVITVLPEYGLTRADERLLRRYATETARLLAKPSVVVELGSGSSAKARWILSRLVQDHPPGSITYCPIDISESALGRCERELSLIRSLRVVPLRRSYLDGLREAVRMREPGTSLLVLFLGSTIGNFEPEAAEDFLRGIRQTLLPGDVLYLSTDLQKSTDRMIAAYDDSIGVTAAFNLNLLARINRELDGNFLLYQFAHEALYDRDEHRVEMHLRSLVDQRVAIGKDFLVGFRRDETIWTESSYKFRLGDVKSLGHRTGFDCEVQWVDEEWPFGQSVLRAK